MASKRLGALPGMKGSALARGCGGGGRGALPLPRAAAVSTRLRVQEVVHELWLQPEQPEEGLHLLRVP